MKHTKSVALAGSAALAAIVIWALIPSRYERVTNLESGGASIIAFGDSLTAGYGAGPGEDYPSRLAEALALPVENAGISGDTTSSALGRVESDVLSRNPRIVVVALGGNDFLRGAPLTDTEATLRTIVRKIQSGGAMVVLLGFTFPSLGANYEAMYERVAEEEGCLLVPRMLEGILSDPSLKSDQIHPNGRGYALMAERVAGPLRRLIAEADAARG